MRPAAPTADRKGDRDPIVLAIRFYAEDFAKDPKAYAVPCHDCDRPSVCAIVKPSTQPCGQAQGGK